MLFAHGALYLLRTPLAAMLPWLPPGNQVFGSVWLTVLSLEALLFTIAIAFILLAMAKERTEHRHKTAALIDPLNRARQPPRLPAGRRSPAQPAPRRRRPRAGDFCRRGVGLHPPHGSVWPPWWRGICRIADDTTRERAQAVAEEIRRRFAAAAREVDGRPVESTVSIGIVISQDAVLDLSVLLAQADHALYRAKGNGRNRVEVGSIEAILDRALRSAAGFAGAVGTNQAAARSAA